MSAAINGHCLCGAVGIELSAPSDQIEICQCTMCRRWGGAFYAAQTGDSCEVNGEENVAIYRSSNWAERAFCRICGSSLWFRFLPTGKQSFSAGLFDEATHRAIEKEIFVDERADWCMIAGDHPRMTGPEILAEARKAGFTFE